MSGKMTDYPRCKTCRHWDDRGRPADRFYDCDNPKILDGIGLDGANIEGRFFSGPDFGCVHHEEKESE